MKNLTGLLKYSVIMMCGVSGSGKTFVARQFEADGYVRLSPDRLVWNEYGREYASLSAQRRHEIYMAAIDREIARLPGLIAAGKRVVIDCSMCKRRRRDAVAAICNAAGVSHIIARLTADPALLAQRLAGRGDTGPDDQTVSTSDLSRFLADFEAPAPDEHFITLPQSEL